MRPTFLIIGTAKAATTSLYHYLTQHPGIFMSPVKEPRFFHVEGQAPAPAGSVNEGMNPETVYTLADYEALFAEAHPEQARGEASPVYLYSPRAAARIHHHMPDARLVAVLRDPADRAHSHYLHLRRLGREPCEDFAEALAQEEARIAAGWEWSWHYRRMGYYDAQLARYAARFGPEQVRVYLYEDVQQDPDAVVRNLLAFIGADPDIAVDTAAEYNTGGAPGSGLLYGMATRYDHPLRRVLRPLIPERLRPRLLGRLRRKALPRPTLDPAVRADLVRGYRDDLLRLEERLGRDLSAWRQEAPHG